MMDTPFVRTAISSLGILALILLFSALSAAIIPFEMVALCHGDDSPAMSFAITLLTGGAAFVTLVIGSILAGLFFWRLHKTRWSNKKFFSWLLLSLVLLLVMCFLVTALLLHSACPYFGLNSTANLIQDTQENIVR